MYKLRNVALNVTTAQQRTPLQAQYNAAIQTTIQVCDVLSIILTFFYGHLVKLKTRINGAVISVTALFILCTIVVKINTDQWQEVFYAITLISAGIMIACIAILTITIYTIIAFFPPQYLAPYLNGGAMSGIINALLQIFSLASGLSPTDSALFYFSYGLLLSLTTLGVTLFITLSHNQFFYYHLRNFDESAKETITFGELKNASKYIWPSLFMMTCHFFCQDLNPIYLVVSANEAKGSIWNKIYFIPVITFLLGSVCNLIGTSVVFKFTVTRNNIFWVIFSLARMAVFIPAFLLCNAHPRHHLPVLLPYDYEFIILVTLYYLSAGYVTAFASDNIRYISPQEEIKSNLRVYMVTSGMIMAFLSFIYVYTVKII